MSIETSRGRDAVAAMLTRDRSAIDHGGLIGHGTAVLTGPDGAVKASCEFDNMVTQVGDEYYMERAAGIGSPPAQVTGMKLGTGSTAVAKSGSGSALTTYLTDSDQAIAGGFPASSLSTGARRISWQAVWAAGKATTGSPITEVVIVNDTLADATSVEAATIARALLAGIASKGEDDTLTITWHHDLEFNAA